MRIRSGKSKVSAHAPVLLRIAAHPKNHIAHGLCTVGRRKAIRQADIARTMAAEAASAAAAGETIDALGYYRFKWSPPDDQQCGTELHVDFDGKGVWNWGLDKSQHVASAADCCAKCQAHAKCNSWVFCPEPVCFAPDSHRHTFGEWYPCWAPTSRPDIPTPLPLLTPFAQQSLARAPPCAAG